MTTFENIIKALDGITDEQKHYVSGRLDETKTFGELMATRPADVLRTLRVGLETSFHPGFLFDPSVDFDILAWMYGKFQEFTDFEDLHDNLEANGFTADTSGAPDSAVFTGGSTVVEISSIECHGQYGYMTVSKRDERPNIPELKAEPTVADALRAFGETAMKLADMLAYITK